jgi:hypothetical protein
MTSKTSESTLLPGRATRQGTERFASRQNAEPDHFARPDDLSLSSIALGTLRGEPGGIDDLLYRSIVDDFVEASGNVFNTALSDRMQTSERALGQAIARLVREQAATRDELIIVTKGGALTPDPDRATSYTAVQRDLYETYIDSQLASGGLRGDGGGGFARLDLGLRSFHLGRAVAPRFRPKPSLDRRSLRGRARRRSG